MLAALRGLARSGPPPDQPGTDHDDRTNGSATPAGRPHGCSVRFDPSVKDGLDLPLALNARLRHADPRQQHKRDFGEACAPVGC